MKLHIMMALALVASACSNDADNNDGSDTGTQPDAARTADMVGATDTGARSDAGGQNDMSSPNNPMADAGGGGDMGTTDMASNPDLGPPNGCGEAPGQLLWPDAPWNSRVDQMALASDSAAVIAYLQANEDTAVTFQIDFSLKVVTADENTPKQAFTPTGDHFSPDCDTSPIPVPNGAEIEGEDGLACAGDGDCHLIVHSPSECRLYEMWRADIDPDFDGGCLAVWETDRAYSETLRGDYCTSADAAGLPIAPLLVPPDEVVAGQINHALRFILPNRHIRSDIYVRPGTHSTGATSGPADAPPYSGLLRLRGDVDLSGLTPAQQTVGRALQQYGMYLADGGNLTFTMSSDRFTQNTWADAGLGPQDMKWLEWTDFELVDTGERIAWSEGSCNRTPVAD